MKDMDIFDKAKVFNHYNIKMLGLKYRCKYWDEPEMAKYNLDYLWINQKRMSFDEFIYNDKRVTDNGEDWASHGYAQRYRTEYYGFTDWYNKFSKDILGI